MKIILVKFTLLLVFLFYGVNCGVEDETYHYIRADSSGGGDGESWSTAWDTLPDDLIRGHTYWVADGSYALQIFDDVESGAIPIYIKKATQPSHGTDQGWLNSMGDGQAIFPTIHFFTSYYVFDGQSGGGPGMWEEGHGFRILLSGSTHGIHLGVSDSSDLNERPDFLELRHIEAGPLNWANKVDVRALNAPSAGEGLGSRNVTISHCFIHDCNVIAFSMYINDWLFEYNYFARSWSDPTHHGTAYADRGGDNVTFRYNLMSDVSGTAYLDIKKNECNDADNWYVYGNVFFCSEGIPYNSSVGGMGVFGSTTIQTNRCNAERDGHSANMRFYHNTMVTVVGLNGGMNFNEANNVGRGNHAFNNLWYQTLANTVSVPYRSGDAHGYNWFYDNWRVDRSPPVSKDQSYFDLDPATNQLGFTGSPSPSPGSGDPFEDKATKDFRLIQNTEPGIDICNEISLGEDCRIHPFDVDMYGTQRNTWTRGSLEYGSIWSHMSADTSNGRTGSETDLTSNQGSTSQSSRVSVVATTTDQTGSETQMATETQISTEQSSSVVEPTGVSGTDQTGGSSGNQERTTSSFETEGTTSCEEGSEGSEGCPCVEGTSCQNGLECVVGTPNFCQIETAASIAENRIPSFIWTGVLALF